MIVLVVNVHACVTYSHVGSWYRTEGVEPSTPVKIVFILWQGHLQSFFMGLLFFLAGVFAGHSLERRGVRSFLKERWRRLGLPSLFYMLLIQPFIIYVLLGRPHAPQRPSPGFLYWEYLASGRVLGGNGPMWFALALLLFCIVLAGARSAKPDSLKKVVSPVVAPRGQHLFAFGALLVIATFLIRLAQPIGTSVFNFQLCFFPQYIAAFAAGVGASKYGWLEKLAISRYASVAGWLGVMGGPLVFTTMVIVGGPPPESGPNLYTGGWNWRAFALAAWEQFTGLALALGLLAWSNRRCNYSGRVARWLSGRSFAVYMLHAPVLVALTPLIRPAVVNPFVGAALLTLSGLVMSFLAAEVARRVPGLKQIL